MISCLSTKRTLWALTAAISLCLGFLFVSGCDQDKYPDDLYYPLRSDPLMVAAPTDPSTQPAYFDLPGEFPKGLLTSLEQKGAKVTEPGQKLNATERDALEKALSDLFGTPAQPRVKAQFVTDDSDDSAVQQYRTWLALPDSTDLKEVNAKAQDALQLDEPKLAVGSALYRRHCLHCHGLTGDGRGHTAPWVNPHPRDFRRGVFKFTSSSQGEGSRKPRRTDLLRTLRQGIEGTAMPSFGLLSDSELNALASYVIHLSLRGETEMYVMFQREKKAVKEAVQESMETFPGRWLEAETKMIQPGPYPTASDDQRVQSVVRGHQIFLNNCFGCHENYGRKDVYKYDVWGTIVRPANLTSGTYRGGRRPIDLYWRVYSGINGANMPAPFENEAPAAKDKDVWDLVNFVQALPYPAMLPRTVSEKIYAPSEIGELADRSKQTAERDAANQ